MDHYTLSWIIGHYFLNLFSDDFHYNSKAFTLSSFFILSAYVAYE